MNLDIPDDVLDAIADRIAERLARGPGAPVAAPAPLPRSRLSNIAEVAAYLCMSTAWVALQVKLGELTGLNLGGSRRRCLRFDSLDVERFATERGRYPSGRIRPKPSRHLHLVPAANDQELAP